MRIRGRIAAFVICALIVVSVFAPAARAYDEAVITPELQTLFTGFDSDHDDSLAVEEAMSFYAWVESAIPYRYDDEDDPDGQQALAMHQITESQLGDGRPGKGYWQKPAETYAEKYGDCEDMAILELAFYTYYSITSYLGIVDVDGDTVVDHAICIVAFSEEAYQWLVEKQGIVQYYDIDGTKFVIVDNAYSDAYGFVGYYDPVTGEAVPYEEVDFTLYETMTLEQLQSEGWNQTEDTFTLDPTILFVVVAVGLLVVVALSYLFIARRRATE